jgi:alanine racemase
VCMNQIMIDITDCPSVLVGDEVELIGDRPGITIAELARVSGSNNERELVARLNPLLPRIVV